MAQDILTKAQTRIGRGELQLAKPLILTVMYAPEGPNDKSFDSVRAYSRGDSECGMAKYFVLSQRGRLFEVEYIYEHVRLGRGDSETGFHTCGEPKIKRSDGIGGLPHENRASAARRLGKLMQGETEHFDVYIPQKIDDLFDKGIHESPQRGLLWWM